MDLILNPFNLLDKYRFRSILICGIWDKIIRILITVMNTLISVVYSMTNEY